MSVLRFIGRAFMKPYCEITLFDSLTVLASFAIAVFAYSWLRSRAQRRAR